MSATWLRRLERWRAVDSCTLTGRMTSDVDRELLLRIARAAIAGHVGAVAPATIDAGEMSRRLGGAFVTLHKGNDLRGCIGHIEADEPLPQVVARCAVEACSSDPRFPPVTAAELPEIEVELSLLGPLEPIEGPADIEVGRHGLVVERGWRRGLLLHPRWRQSGNGTVKNSSPRRVIKRACRPTLGDTGRKCGGSRPKCSGNSVGS